MSNPAPSQLAASPTFVDSVTVRNARSDGGGVEKPAGGRNDSGAGFNIGRLSVTEITIFTKPGCPHCARAKQLLTGRGLSYVELVVGKDVPPRAVRGVSGGSTVPQVFIDGQRIGTADELEKYLAAA